MTDFELEVGRAIHAQILRLFQIYREYNLVPQDVYDLVRMGRYDIVTVRGIILNTDYDGSSNTYDLRYFRCTRSSCGRIFDATASRYEELHRRCPACGSPTVQVLLHYPVKRGPGMSRSVRPYSGNQAAIFSACGVQDPNSRCKLFKVRIGNKLVPIVKRLVRLQRGRPVASLRWGCPLVRVDRQGVSYEYYFLDGNRVDRSRVRYANPGRPYEVRGAQRDLPSRLSPELCPFLDIRQTDEGPAPLCTLSVEWGRFVVKPEGVRPAVPRGSTMSLVRNDYYFRLENPMEPAFKNLLGEFHYAREEDVQDVRFDELSPMVSRVRFAERVRVYNFTFGTFYGSPEVGRSKRVFYVRRTSGGALEFWGRSLVTQGLLLEFDPDCLSAAVYFLTNTDPKYRNSNLESVAETVVHSIGPAVWKSVAAKTGLSFDEFGESIVVNADGRYEYLLFDNASGGLDGVRSALEDEGRGVSIHPDVIEGVVSNRLCAAYCDRACKECLVIPSCRRGNYYLNWRVVNASLEP